MSESEDMIILALVQMRLLDKKTCSKAVKDLAALEFQNIVLKLLQTVKATKNMDFVLPSEISSSGNKYIECQQMADFLKAVAFPGNLSLSDLVTPSHRTKQSLLEFLIELTSIGDNEVEFSSKETEKSMKKKEISRKLKKWMNEPYLLPEMRESNTCKPKITLFSREIELNSPTITVLKASDKLPSTTFIKQQEVQKRSAFSRLNALFSGRNTLNLNRIYIKPEQSKKSTKTSQYLSKSEISESSTTETSIKLDNIFQEAEEENSKLQAELSAKEDTLNQAALDLKAAETALTAKQELALSLSSRLTSQKDSISEAEELLQEKILVFETLSAQKSEDKQTKTSLLDQEIAEFQGKFSKMTENWLEYSNSTKSQIEVLKGSISQKKKEYNYKYDKIGELKEEVALIQQRIEDKRYLKEFLREEYSKIQVDINRNTILGKINELTKHIVDSKEGVKKHLRQLDSLEGQIDDQLALIKRIDNQIEDKLFSDAKEKTKLKPVYAAFVDLRENYNSIQKKILDLHSNMLSNKALKTDLENYQQKIKNVNINELKEELEKIKN